jgi:hypothetical protein
MKVLHVAATYAVKAALEAAGYHQHHRGESRQSERLSIARPTETKVAMEKVKHLLRDSPMLSDSMGGNLANVPSDDILRRSRR